MGFWTEAYFPPNPPEYDNKLPANVVEEFKKAGYYYCQLSGRHIQYFVEDLGELRYEKDQQISPKKMREVIKILSARRKYLSKDYQDLTDWIVKYFNLCIDLGLWVIWSI